MKWLKSVAAWLWFLLKHLTNFAVPKLFVIARLRYIDATLAFQTYSLRIAPSHDSSSSATVVAEHP
jgi:hypothetical protein